MPSKERESTRVSRAVHWDWELPRDRLLWSASLVDLLGGNDMPAETTWEWWEERIHPEDRERERTERQRLAEGHAMRTRNSYRVRGNDGGYVMVSERSFAVHHEGRPNRVIGVINRSEDLDVPRADRTAVLEHLGRGERRFETFVDSMPLLAWEADAEGWIDYYNQRWYEYTGTTPEEMEGWGWVQVHDPLDLPRMLKVWRNALQTGQPWEDEFRLRRGSDGELRWFLSRAVPMRDGEGRILRWFGSNVDIHDQKLALKERERLLEAEQRLRREAQQANREKDQFLAVVSHELRSPLNAVLGWAQLLSAMPDRDAEEAEAAENIERNARSLAKLIEDLLDVSRIVSGKLEIERQPVDATAAVERAVQAAFPSARKAGVEVVLRKAAAAATVLGSTGRLEQVVANLLSNAVKFGKNGGRVEVTVERRGSQVEIQVQDWGDGIAPEFLSNIFDRFRQADSSTRRKHGGLGLGLSIVRHLVDLHGGSVHASSPGVGQGATFTVFLPICDGETTARPRPAESALKSRPASLAGISIIFVDDDPEARQVVARALLSCGATVTVVGSVAEFLEAVRVSVPDAIVSDIAMPEVDGYGLIERVRGSSNPGMRRLPAVALTAHASEADRVQALQAGFDAYVSKPLDIALLSQVIRELVGRQVGG